MKKILLYIDTLNRGGAQRVMANLADAFVSQDLKVILVNESFPEDGENVYCVSPKVERYFLDERIFKNFLLRQIYRIYRLRRIVEVERPDVVLSFLGPTNLRILVATIGISCRKIVSVRNDPNREYGSGIKRLIARMLFRLVDGCVFQTQDAAKYFSESVRNKSKIIFNVVNEKFFNVDRTNIRKEIVSVGRLQPQKNHELLLQAFAKINHDEDLKDFRLIIYGEGELKEHLKHKAVELGIDGHAEFTGLVDNVADKLKTASLFVLPSDYEGMPNALMEAMVAGVPCISTDCPCGGPRMLIKDGENGLLVSVGDVEGLYKAMRRMLTESDLAEKISENLLQTKVNFSNDRITKEWFDYCFQN